VLAIFWLMIAKTAALVAALVNAGTGKNLRHIHHHCRRPKPTAKCLTRSAETSCDSSGLVRLAKKQAVGRVGEA
jgi:hypothetical protein